MTNSKHNTEIFKKKNLKILQEEAIETSTNLAGCFMSKGMIQPHMTEWQSETPSCTKKFHLGLLMKETIMNNMFLICMTQLSIETK